MGRTNELDSNATVTHETFTCAVCGKGTSFLVFRTPEYTRDGQTAMSRNIGFSDGTLLDGEGTGAILDGTPGKDAYYTGYHWTKAVCETCGSVNSNLDVTNYAFTKNVYWLYDCAAEFTEVLPETVAYEYTDSACHTKTTKTGTYCGFCFGTHKTETSVLERHDMAENGVAYVWLRDETTGEDSFCSCGCQDKDCNGGCCVDQGCGDDHHFILLDSTKASCLTLGYDRYLCTALERYSLPGGPLKGLCANDCSQFCGFHNALQEIPLEIYEITDSIHPIEADVSRIDSTWNNVLTNGEDFVVYSLDYPDRPHIWLVSIQ